MRKLVLGLAVLALICGGWYFASPWLAMKGLADAAKAGDLAALEERIDFVALRENAAGQIVDAAHVRQQQGEVLDRIGGVIAERLGPEISNRVLTPENMSNLVATGSLAAALVPERLRGQEISWDVYREGWDRFRAVGTFEDGTLGPFLIFERDGIGWVLTDFDLCLSQAPCARFGSIH